MSVLHIHLFGGLCIKVGDRELARQAGRLSKPQELLTRLLLQREGPVSNEQLMEDLWGEDEVSNPAAALKNAVYSLRRSLREGDAKADLIITQNGRYLWNPDIPVWVDAWEFEKLAAQGAAASGEEAERLCRKALSLYTGDLLPGLSDRPWVFSYQLFLRQRYQETVLGLCRQLGAAGTREGYEEILDLCNRAVLMLPLQEPLYIQLFAAMKALDMRQGVLSYYPVVSDLFFDELGEKLCPELQEIYAWASGGGDQTRADLRQIQQDLAEVTRDSRPIRGAYYCEYEVFKHIYHMVARSAERAGNTVAVMLVSLTGSRGTPVPKHQIGGAMNAAKGIIRDLLRKGDVFSRYSRSQYILMLPVARLSDCSVVEERLRASCKAAPACAGVSLDIQTSELDSIL